MKIMRGLLAATILILAGCKKQDLITAASVENDPVANVRKGFIHVPWIRLPLTRCIYSYHDAVDALGSNLVTASAVVLSNGIIIQPGSDLKSVTYEAISQTQANSLFGSKLTIEWRWPGGNWQLYTSEVWSLGCVYQVAGEPPCTNLIKGKDILQINTCFFWGTNEYTGERIAYVMID